MKKILIFTLCLILFSSGAFGWYYGDLEYRQEIQVNATQVGYSVYQTELNVTYDSDMNSDFSDVRFTQLTSDENKITYYLYDKTDSAWAWFYINITSNVTHNQTIYVYYNNRSLTSTLSNSTDLFEYEETFDNYASTASVLNVWTSVGGTSDIELVVDGSNKLLRLGDDSGVDLVSPLTGGVNTETLFQLNYTTDIKYSVFGVCPNETAMSTIYANDIGTGTSLFLRSDGMDNNNVIWRTAGSLGSTDSGVAPLIPNYNNLIRMQHRSGIPHILHINYNNIFNNTYQSNTGVSRLRFQGSGSGDANYYIDNIFIKTAWVGAPSSSSFGTEENNTIYGDGYSLNSFNDYYLYEIKQNQYNLSFVNDTSIGNVTAKVEINDTNYTMTPTIGSTIELRYEHELDIYQTEGDNTNLKFFYDVGYTNGTVYETSTTQSQQETKFAYSLDSFSSDGLQYIVANDAVLTLDYTNVTDLATITSTYTINNTAYSMDEFISVFNDTLMVPISPDTYNITAFMNISYGSESRNVSSSFNISVINYEIVSCTSGNITMTLNLFDEIGRLAGNGTADVYVSDVLLGNTNSFNLTGNSTYNICMNPFDDRRINAVIRYKLDEHDDHRFYYLQNHSIGSTVETIDLYSLSNGNSTFSEVLIQDTDLNPQEGRRFALQRFYEDLGTHITVAMGTTNSEGKDIINYKANDVLYRFVVYDEDVVDEIFDSSKYSTSTISLTLTGTPHGEFYRIWNQITVSCSNTSSTIDCDVIDGSGRMVRWALDVDKFEDFGFENVCDLSTTGSSLSCDVTNTTGGFFKFNVVVEFQDLFWMVLSDSIDDSTHIDYGLDGVLITMFFIMSFAGIGMVISPDTVIYLVGVAFFISYAFGFIQLNLESLGAILVLLVLYINKTRS